MLELTKRLHTETEKEKKAKTKHNWKELFNDLLEHHSEVGLYLKGLRLREGYTQVQLAEMIDVSPANISAMEHGKRPIGKNIAMRIASVFNVNYQRFL
jgi:DNA-binding XRE family transcriptional regulator